MHLTKNIQIIDDDSKNEHKYQVTLNINGYLPALVNSLRRVMISEIPNVGFDHKTSEDSSQNPIRIINNTSALHNEFIAHRIALVPICTYNSGRLNINSIFNKELGQRENHFQWRGEVPKFILHVVNNEETRQLYNSTRNSDLEIDDNIIIVTTNDFKIQTSIEKPDPDQVESFIIPDIITLNSEEPSQRDKNRYKSYIILNKLKMSSSEKGESLNIVCVPSIGTGEIHTIYSPVGTVSYKFIKASQEQQEEVFKYYLANLSVERINKGLSDFDEEEKAEIRKSYDFLDAKRVYLRDEKGNANSIQMKVESIGGMLPVQIVHNAINVLSWKLRDIISSCIAKHSQTGLTYELLGKIDISESPTKMDAYDIKINDEGHTIGNLVTKYLQDLYLGNILDFVSYQKPHPLENSIIIRFKIVDNCNIIDFIGWIKENSSLINPRLTTLLTDLDLNKIKGDSNDKKFIVIFIFLQGLNAALHNLQFLNTSWQTLSEPIIQKVKNNNFLSFAPDNENDEWFPNIDIIGKHKSDLMQPTLYAKLTNELSRFIES